MTLRQDLSKVSTEDLKLELQRREPEEVCPVCSHLQRVPEPGRHHPACTANPAYRSGDWS